MCRLLCVRAERPFDLHEHLEPFAALSRHSREYQGHGWGCAWREDGGWRIYRNIKPVWEDSEHPLARTTLLLAHARSAFRDEGICVENNMPFFDGEHVFIFNGELRGVRIKAAGRIGAEKVFKYVKRFDHGDTGAALMKGVRIISRRTRYVRSMNIIMASLDQVHVASQFDEDPDYFQMQESSRDDRLVVCSERYPGVDGWAPIANGTVRSY